MNFTVKYAIICVGIITGLGHPVRAEGKAPTVWAAISVTQPLFELENVDKHLSVQFALVNDGNKPIDPAIGISQLLVNGTQLPGWKRIVASGPRDERFEELSPGKALRFGYDLSSLFQNPGVYTLVWKGNGFQSPEIVFRVLPATSSK